ncbi:ABC transporter ATP-binding protein [Neorhizobium alkalisoli]|nr:ABC transporter ATP-binding protein [Neorhizobium alkalisoli]
MLAGISLEGLSVSFNGVRVLHGVDLSIGAGETLGLVGESGSGKSVTWLAALGLLPPRAKVTGRVLVDGKNLLDLPESKLAGIRGRRVAMIFQDPASALNPMLTIRRQIGEALSLHRGISGASLKAEAKRLLDLVGIPDAERRLNAYPHEFSGGQNQRIMIAMALAGQPDLLIADEPTTALDVTIQAQILDLLALTQRETGMALVLISHDLGVVSQVCDRVAVMYAGRVVEEAKVEELFDRPAHPYTRGLIGSLPYIDGPRQRLTAIGGTVPDANKMPAGCAFAPRCAYVETRCRSEIPLLSGLGRDHNVACFADDVSRPSAIGRLPAKEFGIEGRVEA